MTVLEDYWTLSDDFDGVSDLARDMLRLHSFLMDIPKALLEHTAGN